MLGALLTLVCLTLSGCEHAGSAYAGRYLPMDIRGMGGNYRDAPVFTDNEDNWDMMDVVKVI
jgi:hypothetical protein